MLALKGIMNGGNSKGDLRIEQAPWGPFTFSLYPLESQLFSSADERSNARSCCPWENTCRVLGQCLGHCGSFHRPHNDGATAKIKWGRTHV